MCSVPLFVFCFTFCDQFLLCFIPMLLFFLYSVSSCVQFHFLRSVPLFRLSSFLCFIPFFAFSSSFCVQFHFLCSISCFCSAHLLVFISFLFFVPFFKNTQREYEVRLLKLLKEFLIKNFVFMKINK